MVRLLQQLKSLTAQGATRLGRQLDARARWDGQATWYRLRYDDAEQTRSALDLLSRCSGGRHSGRVGLRWRTESGVSRLYVGLFSVELNRLAGEMARDLGFTLTAAPQLAAAEDDYLHDGVDALPSPLSGAFCYAPASGETAGQGETGNIAGAGDGYIINGHLFALQRGRANGAALTAGYAFPTTAAVNGHTPGLWRLPPPVLGLALRPQWRPPLSLDLPAAAAEQVGGEAWLLGRNVNRQPVYGQRVSVLGELDAIQQWLAQLVVAQAVCNPVGVAVIDGEGDLVPRLLTEPVIARLLQTKRATALDVNIVGQGGVNPLAPLPGETAERTTARWRDWFARMGAAESGLALLPNAYAAGATSLLELRHWLEQLARDEKTTRPTFVAAAALRAVLDRLLADGTTARWLCQQPVDLGALLPRGMLLVSCPYQRKRSRAQALRALPPILTFHGAAVILRLGARAAIPLSREEMNSSPFIRIVTDSADLAETVIVTRSEGHRLASLTNHLLPQLCPDGIAPQMFQEYVGQLGAGEALALRQGRVSWVGWR
jgi:hypothetical protein